MRILFLFFFLALSITTTFSQSRAVKQFYDKYQSMEQVTDVKLQGWVLKLASSFSDEESAEKLLRKISHLRIMIMEEGNLVAPAEYRRLLSDVKKDRFEELFKVKEGDDNIDFLIREDQDTITDVLIMVTGDDGFILLSLEGALKFSDLNDINIDIDGAEHFRKIPESKKDIPRA